MNKVKYSRLQELDRSNFEITKGDPDIRGWDVRYRNGEKIGSVEELIFDAKAKKVRYMVVDLDENELRLEDRKILIPIGFAELDKGNDDVLIPNVSVDQICSLPDYNRNSLTHEVERKISSVFGRKVNIEPNKPLQTADRNVMEDEDVDPDFYSHEHYRTDNLYRNRRNKTAKPRLDKESEYDDGLRLWEKRNESDVIDTSDLSDEEREKLLRYRRELYRERRYKNESV
jgi:sporulation protein YlmC with PRC-barrel domain